MKQKKQKEKLLGGLLMKRLLIMVFSISLMAASFAQQTQKIGGTVTDATNGESLIGVSVLVEGTTTGAITDANGKYSLNAPKDAVITFSFMGYVPEKVVVTGTIIDVKLVPDVKKLDEVVVVGYGTVKKKDVTGSVASVKSAELLATSPVNIQQGLQGKTSGIVVSKGDGVNDIASIRVRGNRSMTAGYNDPLYVIDGIPSTGMNETINPSDIESVEILKDASATAIYGSRGANGVILITTKKGEEGKITVQYDGYTSIGTLDRYRPLKTAAQYLEENREANRVYAYDGNGGYSLDLTKSGYKFLTPDNASDLAMQYVVQDKYNVESVKQGWVNGVYDPSKVRSFDYLKANFRSQAVSQSHNISIRGGSKNTKVFASGSFYDLQDMRIQSDRKQYTLRLTVDQNLGKRMSMGGTVNFSYLNWYGGKTINGFWSPLSSPYKSPDGDVTKAGDPSLGLLDHPGGESLYYNDFYNIAGVTDQNANNKFTGSLYFQVNILKGLTYRANFGTNLNYMENQHFQSHYSAASAFGNASAYDNTALTRYWLFDNILTYNTKISDHSIAATLVQSNEKNVDTKVQNSGVSIPVESQLWDGIPIATTQAGNNTYSQYTLQSWLGRVNYSFKDRYLLTASIRYDGSSRLAPGHQWTAFPSVALGWRISEESFLKNNPIVDNLKLRFGYGVTGAASVDPYSSQGLIISSRYNWDKTTGAFGYMPNTLANSTLSWEKTGQYDAAIDFSLFKGRISGTFEVYLQKTTNLLSNMALPAVSGFGNIKTNIGETQNKGLEFTLNTTNIDTKKINWTTTFIFDTNREEILSLSSGLQQDLGNSWFVGEPIDTYYDYVNAPTPWGYSKADYDVMNVLNANGGQFKPGDFRVLDKDGNNKITEADKRKRGHKMPLWNASIANTFTYGPFDLFIFVRGSFGNTINWDPGVDYAGRYNGVNADYWTPEHTNTRYAHPIANTNTIAYGSGMNYFKGDFIKISDISLGYTLPNKLSSKVGISKAHFYVKVQNPYLWTKEFFGNDPEGAISQTRSGGAVPTYGDQAFTMKTYMLGLNLTF